MNFAFAFFILPLFAQEEIPIEKVFQKLESRLAPIGSVSAQVRVEADKEPFTKMDAASWIHCQPGKMYRKELVFWDFNGVLLFEEMIAVPGEIASRNTMISDSGGSFAVAVKGTPEEFVRHRNGVADLYFTLRVGGFAALWEVALWPRILLSRCSDLSAKRKKGSIVISGSMLGRQLRWHFKEPGYRIEKLVVTRENKSINVLAREYIEIGGVPIPSRIELRKPDKNGEMKSTFPLSLHRVVSPARPALPNWFEDPALPAPTSASLEELEKKLKQDPANGKLVMALANRLELGARRIDNRLPKLSDYRKAALKANPESRLLSLADFLGNQSEDGVLSREGMEKVVREGTFAFDALAAGGTLAFEGMEFGKARALLAQIPDRGVAAVYRERNLFPSEASAIESAGEFMKRLGSILEALPFERKWAYLWRCVGALKSKSLEFLRELADSGDRDFVLLAARTMVRQEWLADACNLYLLLVDDREYAPHLESELRSFCRRYFGAARPLVEKIADRILDVEVLLYATAMAFGEKREAPYIRLKKRLLHCLSLQNKNYHLLEIRWTVHLVPFLEGLLKAKRFGDAREILLAYSIGPTGFNLLYGKESDLLRRILADSPEEKVLFLKEHSRFEPAILEKFGISLPEIFADIHGLIEADRFTKVDLQALWKIVIQLQDETIEGIDPAGIVSLLRKGVSRWFPDEERFREQLGDALQLAGDLPAAIESYVEVLRLRKKAKGETMYTEWWKDPEAAPDIDRFHPLLPTLVKIVSLYVALGEKAAAVQVVEKFLQDFSYSADLSEAIAAYRVLGMIDRVILLKKKRFLQGLDIALRKGLIGESDAAHGMDLLQLCMEEKKYIEAYFAADLLLKHWAILLDPDELKKLEKWRDVSRGKLTPDVWLRAWEKFEFAPVSANQKTAVDAWIERMNSDRIDLRDEAFEKLREMGAEISPYLFERLKGHDAEVAGRLRDILVSHAKKALLERFLEK